MRSRLGGFFQPLLRACSVTRLGHWPGSFALGYALVLASRTEGWYVKATSKDALAPIAHDERSSGVRGAQGPPCVAAMAAIYVV